MTTYTKNEFPIVKQASDELCGPACVEMLLKYYGIRVNKKPPYKSLQAQISTLYGETPYPGTESLTVIPEGQSDRWKDFFTRPIEIVNMLHGIAKAFTDNSSTLITIFDPISKLPQLWMHDFSLKGGDEDIANFLDRLMEKFRNQDHPPLIIPIHGNSHWVILNELTVPSDDDELPRDVKKYKNWSFNGKDPFNKGIINISGNFSNFDEPANLVVIEFTDMGSNANSRHGWVNSPLPPVTPVRSPGKPIDRQLIPEIVHQALIDYGIRPPDILGRRVSSERLSDPLLVTRLDRPNYDFYLVALLEQNNNVNMLIRLDAQTGDYLDSLQIDSTPLILGVKATDPVNQSMLRSINPQPVNSVNARQANIWFQAFTTELKKTDAQGNNIPNLMWQPSRDSQSAFFPFYKVTVGDQSSYVRIDGRSVPPPTETPVIAPESSHM